MVIMWTWYPDRSIDQEAGWLRTYQMNFVGLWKDDSYIKTLLPKNLLMIMVVSPSDPELVYFHLEQHMFGVNMPAHRSYEMGNIMPHSDLLQRPYLEHATYKCQRN